MFSGLPDWKFSSMETNRSQDALWEVVMKCYGLNIPLTYQE